jgi:hypothetical protein
MNTTSASRHSSRSLSLLLALALISLSVLSLSISNALQIISNWQVHQRALAAQQQSLAHGVAVETQTFLDARWNMLNTAIRMSDLATAPVAHRIEALQRLLALDPSFEQVTILDEKRFVVAAVSQNRQRTPNFLDTALVEEIVQQTGSGTGNTTGGRYRYRAAGVYSGSGVAYIAALARTLLLVDITGVPVVDSQVAQGLPAIGAVCSVAGHRKLIGIRPEVAQTIMGLGMNLLSFAHCRRSANVWVRSPARIIPRWHCKWWRCA